MEQPKIKCNFGEQQIGNVESQSLSLPIRALFSGTRQAIRSRRCAERYGN
jgi:hypothetical protein